ncbi:MAG: hypothetical protein IPI58_01325 [Alphaproteobacteria bacterium]|nr:MAG: hypothetical protein IPI58_01325 [Alphaproteobacteria bacterium]
MPLSQKTLYVVALSGRYCMPPDQSDSTPAANDPQLPDAKPATSDTELGKSAGKVLTNANDAVRKSESIRPSGRNPQNPAQLSLNQ